jgi:hypothetical protein
VFTASVAGPVRRDRESSRFLHSIGKAKTELPTFVLFWNRPEALLLKLGSSTVGSTISRRMMTGRTYEHVGRPIENFNGTDDFKAGTPSERKNKNNPVRDLSFSVDAIQIMWKAVSRSADLATDPSQPTAAEVYWAAVPSDPGFLPRNVIHPGNFQPQNN